MSKLETPMILHYWQSVGGLRPLLAPYPAVDVVVVPGTPTLPSEEEPG